MKQLSFFARVQRVSTCAVLGLLLGSLSAQAQLSGTYTIDKGAPTAGTSYASFGAAMAALGVQGIAGPVVFNVVAGSSTSAAPYTEQVVVPAYAGSSATQGVTLNGNGNYLSFAGTSTNSYVLRLDGCARVTVNSLLVSNTAAATNNVGGIGLTGTSFCTIAGCTVTLPLSALGDETGGINLGASAMSPITGAPDNNALITGNTITGGFYGFSANGTSASIASCVNNVFTNNTVRDSYAYPCYATFQTSPQISGNDISRPTRTNTSTLYALYLAVTTGARVEKNRVHNMFDGQLTSTAPLYGLYNATPGSAAAPNEFLNNVLYNLNGAGNQFLLFLGNANYVRFYNNTAVSDDATGGSSTTYGVFQNGAAVGSEVVNNNIVVTRGGTGAKFAYFSALPTASASTNNNLYASGPNAYVGYFGNPQPTLAAWQAASGLDANSVSVAPGAASPTDYTPTNAALNNAGSAAIAGPGQRVSDDLTGAARSATPDIGAYEFTPTPLPVHLVAFTAQAQATGVALAWRTASELNSAHFEVERSPDGGRFTKVGEVAAAGYSATTRTYAYTDAPLPAGASLLYYRLRQVDQDGTATYSPVRTVSLPAAGLALYPNPAGRSATLSGAAVGALVQVYDARGRLVLAAQAGAAGTAALLLPASLPAGLYLVRSGAGPALRLTVH
ncbi:T9SS type A sorting domain-containing protein [Hymenobacter sp. HMF4947]|uniref:T9SS type A sorting domain-containing protein n=1 Tax=Hymenobacter ginkgonis TaxID=2682976 RepID=A0A7K1TK22_9BACT|nr:T9SS type A sorting domain-containing protein [Hymenobacter ginkgonis]MVN78745.1 T9SS type A sorting domain-containing protein [Hymenobacter ginkgonis]